MHRPSFVVEILSHNYTLAEMQTRMVVWIANGVELAWLIDPDRKVVEIYRACKTAEVQKDRTTVYGEGPVGGFVLKLARIWS